MPALPPVSKVMRIDLFETYLQDVHVRDRIYFQFAGAGPTTADLTTLGTTISAAWNTNMSPILSTAFTLSTIQLTDLTSNTGAQNVVTAARAGTDATAVLSAGVAAVIRFKISRRYRGGHPRFYLCGIPQAKMAATGIWNTSFTAALQSDWAAFITACEASPPTNIGAMTHVNVSYFAGFTNKTFPSGRTHPVSTLRGTPMVDAINSYSINPNPASQRRRNVQST